MPLKDVPAPLRKQAVDLPAASSRKVYLKGGDQAAEWTISAIKRNLVLLFLLSRNVPNCSRILLFAARFVSTMACVPFMPMLTNRSYLL